ncbi:MAG: RNA-binding protein [Acidobacteria bacterium]|nr:MAG: RNA-binding protein [Acidobacteriota bacterium]
MHLSFNNNSFRFMAALLASLFTSAWLSLSQPANSTSSAVQFVDVAQPAGLRDRVVNGGEKTKKYVFESTGSGVAVFDYDGDDHPDIFVVNGSCLEGFPSDQAPTNHLYRNNGDATFVDVTAKAGLIHSGWGQGVCVGDYDNDGNSDLFVTYYGSSNLLYHNDGQGHFSNVTLKAGLDNILRNWSTGCAFVDYDKDGFLDLFVAGYVDLDLAKTPLPGANSHCRWKGVPVFCGPRGLPAAKNHLYHNNRNGAFTEVSLKAGIQMTSDCYGLSAIGSDFQNRGWPDLYVACDSTPSLLYHNNGNGTFRETGIESGVAFNQDGFTQAGMGVSVGDYDGDGWLDILKTNFEDDVPDLYRNSGNGTFTFETYDAKLGFQLRYLSWGGGFFDFDNDGWCDIFIANGHVYPEPETQGLGGRYRQRNLLFRNLGNGTFDDVTKLSGPGLELERSGRGVAFADFDGDGDIDIVINNQNDLPTLLKNEGGNRKNCIQVKLRGTRSNRDGIGARVSVLAGDRKQIDEVRSGGSYLSQNDLCLHFGIGDMKRVDEVEVRWPSGAVDRIKDVLANQRLFVEEGRGLLRAIRLALTSPSRNHSQ